MKRQFVPFDDSYRVPVDVCVSRGVWVGDRLFICGQMDLDAAGQARNLDDLWAQTDTAMHLLFDVVEHADFAPEDIIQLHVFYRAPTNEADYLRKILANFPQCTHALIVLTPVVSFPSKGAEVEIDAIALRGGILKVTRNPKQRVVGRRQGRWMVAENTPSAGTSLSAQIAHIHRDLAATLDQLGATINEVCKVAAYFSSGIDKVDLARAEQQLASGFADAAPTYHGIVLPTVLERGELVRVEISAMAGELERKRVMIPWCWPEPITFSQGIRCADVVFVGAQLPVTGDAKLLHADDLAGQTHLVMNHMKTVLSALNTGFAHMTKVNAYFTAEQDLAQWSVNVGIRSGYYVKPGPASTGIETRALSVPGAMISVDCIAIDES